jgi:hypothetical protein
VLGSGGTGGRPWPLFPRDEDDTDESELLRSNEIDLLVAGVRFECCDFAAESVVPAEVLERMDTASTSVPRRFRSGVEAQFNASPL